MHDASPVSSSRRTDAEWRARIGPWTEGDLPPLDEFAPDTNFVVRAAAGSGKTTALVARMVALVRTGAAEIQDLAAITFTRKAASEMKERLYEELLSARAVLNGEKGTYSGSEAERQNVEQALARVQQCFVGTVHSFCGRLLREHALEAGLPPDFAVGIDERDEADLRSRVWERYVQDAYRSRDDLLGALEDIGLQPKDLTGLFETVSAYPELELYTQPPSTLPDLDAAVERAAAFVRTWQAHRPDSPRKDRDGAQQALDKAERLIESHALDTPARQAQLLSILEGGYSESRDKGRVTLSAWGERGSDAYEASRTLRDEAYPDLVASALDPVLREWRAHVHARAIEFVEPAAETYREARREEGLLTHHDVLYHTRNLLRDHPEVRRTAYERTPRLLVDEFQDTDPLQAEILFYLTARDRTTTDWTECVPAPGSLFIVGDDKQSIYRFRRADIDTFNAVVDRVRDAGGEVATLTRNFRSYEQICSFCDEVFETAFAEPELNEVQADYTPFLPHRPPGRDEYALRRLVVGDKDWNDATAIAWDAADQIAGFIQRTLDEGEAHEMAGPPDTNPVFDHAASPDDFIILTGGKSRLAIYGEALARAGVPFTITGSNDLSDSDDLKDLVDLLTCALRPGDELAAVAYLQGGLCGFSDDDLYRVRRAFDEAGAEPFRFERAEVPQRALDALSDTLARRYERAVERVRRARETVESKRPGRALPEILRETSLPAAAAHAPPEEISSIRAGRVLRAASLMRQQAGEGADWAEVLAVLQDVLDGEVEADGLTLESGSDRAVRIMNLHQVKGLEAPVVFLADPYPETGRHHSPTRHVRREEGDLVAPITKETPGGDVVTHPPLGWDGEDGFAAIEERHEAAEKKRLVYVAATRAERLLVVSEYHDDRKGRRAGDWADLYAAIDEVPVLDPASPSHDRTDRPPPALDAHRDRRRAAVEQVQTPSFAVADVSSEREERAGQVSEDGGAGYGRVVGIAVHTLLETIVRQGTAGEAVSEEAVRRHLAAAADEGADRGGTPVDVSDAAVDTVHGMVKRFLASAIADRVAAADRVFAEYPVSGVEGEAPPTVYHGIIDLVYKDAAGWHVVDYKTDRVGDEGIPASIGTHSYAEQVRRYVQAWEDIAGEPVADAALWFADADELVELAV